MYVPSRRITGGHTGNIVAKDLKDDGLAAHLAVTKVPQVWLYILLYIPKLPGDSHPPRLLTTNFMKNVFILLLLTMFTGNSSFAQDQPAGFTIENYYKVKWGHADEFIALWKQNHYPLLKKLKEKGDILSINARSPIIHSSEDSRWDFKVALTFKTAQLAFDYSITEPFKKQLFPDAVAYKKAEQYRFELILAHWDVPVEAVQLN